MKIIFKIHFLFYVSAFICFITGMFKEFVILSCLIIIHELGHIITGMLFKWKIEKVIILPFGGLTIFNQKINASLIQEFLIAISGFIFQTSFYLLINKNYLFTPYHYSLLLFNIIPIYPLDGSKILNILLNKIFPFKFSYLMTLFLSISFIIILLIYIIINKLNLFLILALIFLINKVINEFINIKYIFNKFLLERYLYHIQYSKVKKVTNIKQFYREKTHLIKNNNKYIKENEILNKMFDNKS